MSHKDALGLRALNPDFRGICLTYFIFEEVFYKNLSTLKILSQISRDFCTSCI